jgi:uncharacterized protein YutE (UPF0331/DUF86 family)
MGERGLPQPFDGQTVEDVVRAYEQEGYTVVRDPNVATLPDFLAPYRPAMIAYKDGEQAVVEVKTQGTLREATSLPALTAAVNAHEQEGWRVDLYTIPPTVLPAVNGRVEELNQDELRARVRSVYELVQRAQAEAALLLAWSVTEAALRQFARRESVTLKNERPLAVITTLYSLGLLSREDYDFLREAKRARDVIVHGFRAPDLAPDFVLHLLEKVERRFHPVAA